MSNDTPRICWHCGEADERLFVYVTDTKETGGRLWQCTVCGGLIS